MLVPHPLRGPSTLPSSSSLDQYPKSPTILRGGNLPPAEQVFSNENLDLVVQVVQTVTNTLITCGRTVLPPTVAIIRSITQFYRSLPTDAVVAQVGLAYCFAGGYYPTLFSSLQAAQQCGWNTMVDSVADLTEEAIKVIDASAQQRIAAGITKRDLFMQQSALVLRTVDPVKINMAASALYTTWLGVSTVLKQEYARVISLSLTLAGYFERICHYILEPPVRLCVQKDYHKWVPIVIGWGCKAAAMNIAWRIQRVLTASTSALAGGLMFSRAFLRLLSGKKDKKGRWKRASRKLAEVSRVEELLGFLIAGLGLYSQIIVQYKRGFSFAVPFPLNLITWPLDWAEKWIQWNITN